MTQLNLLRAVCAYAHEILLPEGSVAELRAMQEAPEHPQRQSDALGVEQGLEDAVFQTFEDLDPLATSNTHGGNNRELACRWKYSRYAAKQA